MVPPLDAATGLLCLRRHHVTLDAVKAHYVDAPEFCSSATRHEIWADFEDATEVFRGIRPTAYVWIAGSFVTNKLDPDDLDLIYWCEDRLVDAVSDPATNCTLQMCSRRSRCGLRRDTTRTRAMADGTCTRRPRACSAQGGDRAQRGGVRQRPGHPRRADRIPLSWCASWFESRCPSS